MRALVGLLASSEGLVRDLVKAIDSIVTICNRALCQADVDSVGAKRVILVLAAVFDANSFGKSSRRALA